MKDNLRTPIKCYRKQYFQGLNNIKGFPIFLIFKKKYFHNNNKKKLIKRNAINSSQ